MDKVFPAVVQTVAGEDFTVYAYMLDGTIRLYDAKPLISKGGVFEALKNEDFFKGRLTVLNDTVAWDLSGKGDPSDCIDIDPFTLESCPEVSDRLQEIS